MTRKPMILVGSGVMSAATTTVPVGRDLLAQMLQPDGPGASRIAWLGWAMFAIAAFVFFVVMGFLLYGLFRRRPRTTSGQTLDDDGGTRMVIMGGVVFPIVVLLVLFVVTLVALRAQAREDDGAHVFTVDVTAHRWWWEIQYPDQGFTTANELHIPTGEPVQVDLTSTDVIHSFWVPQLQRKVDAIPGRTNTVTLQADTAGTYQGVCSEFCGIQHAHMRFQVIAQAQSDFDAWVQGQQAVPQIPASGAAFQGQQVFLGSSCVYCHSVSGTNATGVIGPDLTHVASRSMLAAGTIPNTPANLERWIADPSSIKPGVLMPGSDLTAAQMRDLIAYLESLS